MNLWGAITRGPSSPAGAGELEEQRYTVDDYISWTNSFSYNGVGYDIPAIQQTLSGNTEKARSDYAGLVQTAYAANGVVFACMLARQLIFSAIRFQWQGMNNGQPGRLFGTPSLAMLEEPWDGGTTQDLLNRMINDADIAGNWYATPYTPLVKMDGDPSGTEVARLRPDWVDVVLTPREINGGHVGWRKLGYVYTEGGPASSADPVPMLARDVAHFAPVLDPLATFRGMSWLTPIIREVQADKLMTTHKRRFFENGATPNMIIKHPESATLDKVRAFREMLDDEHAGVDNAYKRLHVGGGADVTIVGANMQEMTFKEVQGMGETRIAAAARISPVIVGLSEGLSGSSLNAGNYGQARRNVADGTMHPMWQNAAGSLQKIVTRPPGQNRLWYDARNVPFLREDAKDAAGIQQVKASTIGQLVRDGFTTESAVAAVNAEDMTLLVHTGLLSVQLQPPGSITTPAAVPAITGSAG